ncbi:MAG: YkgJ family cysteine cluster protein [Bacillota bacterium]|jgi:hypothetical protein
MRVEAIAVPFDRGLGLDVVVYDAAATVEDLAKAYAAAADDVDLHKEQRHASSGETCGSCFGCTYCCRRFNIFLSRLDVLQLAAAEGVAVEEFMAFCTAYEPWKVDRVRLADPRRYCLRDDGQGCDKYEQRPLICRLYICCPHSERARQLIGEVNRWAEEDLVNWRSKRTDEGNPFNNKFAYSQVLLKDCVDEQLWRQLYQPGHSFRPVA